MISGPDISETTTPNANMNSFTGLTPNTIYTITVTPYNNAGDGTPNSVVVMTLPTGKRFAVVLCTFCIINFNSNKFEVDVAVSTELRTCICNTL